MAAFWCHWYSPPSPPAAAAASCSLTAPSATAQALVKNPITRRTASDIGKTSGKFLIPTSKSYLAPAAAARDALAADTPAPTGTS